MYRPTFLALIILFVATSAPIALGEALGEELQADKVAFFESNIRPVLVAKCYECHATDSKIVRGGLLLDSAEGLLAGGDTGPAIVVGKPGESLLVEAIRHESTEMPPDERLPESVIKDFETWIQKGAVDPRTGTEVKPRVDPLQSKNHWAFQKITHPKVPLAKADLRNPIDAFVAAKHEQHNFAFAEPADKHTFIRRASFDLIGLPPSQAEIQEFIADDTAGSFQRLIDRLLASPHYGQRWGRHWLDLVRYADTNGADENHKMPNAWRYRDWVIDALNEDLPFDDFVLQQLAGDLLPAPKDETEAGKLLIATGMLVIGPKMLAEQDKEKMRIDIIDEQIDTISKTMFGMTVACARCHDHKFDPISTEDYYALAGVFASTRSMLNEDFVSKWMERPLPSQHTQTLIEEHQAKIDAAKKEELDLVNQAKTELLKRLDVEKLPSEPEKQFSDEFKKQIEASKKKVKSLTDATPKHEMAMAVESTEPKNLPVHIRGNHRKKSNHDIPRGVPKRLREVASCPSIAPTSGGRLEFARWLTSTNHPLTARVMANRIWMWHFGEPLADSPSNFGLQLKKPLHADLLDWLASRLMQGWSIKQMHRLIMSSKTYRQASHTTTHAADDPENTYLWRQHQRRLEVEPLRDAILLIGDDLDRRFGGAGQSDSTKRRTVYFSINRAALTEVLSTFDYVEPANHIDRRPTTTVPGQALFLLNNDLVHQQSKRIASRILTDCHDDTRRAERLLQQIVGLPPEAEDVERLVKFVDAAKQSLPGNPDQKELAAWSSAGRTLIAGWRFCYVQ